MQNNRFNCRVNKHFCLFRIGKLTDLDLSHRSPSLQEPCPDLNRRASITPYEYRFVVVSRVPQD